MSFDIQGLGWFLRRTEDPIGLGEFYHEVLGLPYLRSWDQDGHVGYMMWAGEVCVLEINKIETPECAPQDSQCTPIFETNCMSYTHRRLCDARTEIVRSERDERSETRFYRDPHGFEFGIEFVYNKNLLVTDQIKPLVMNSVEIEGCIKRLSRVLHYSDTPAEDAVFLNEEMCLKSLEKLNGNLILALGDAAILEIRPSETRCKRPDDRESVRDTWILREYSHQALVSSLHQAGAEAINSLQFPGGELDYFVTPGNRLFGFQQRKPYNSKIETTQHIEDIFAWNQWQLTQAL